MREEEWGYEVLICPRRRRPETKGLLKPSSILRTWLMSHVGAASRQKTSNASYSWILAHSKATRSNSWVAAENSEAI